MGLLCPIDDSTGVTSSSDPHPAPTEIEEGLLKIFESIGLPIPTPVKNLASASYSLDPFCMFTGRSSIHPPFVKVP